MLYIREPQAMSMMLQEKLLKACRAGAGTTTMDLAGACMFTVFLPSVAHRLPKYSAMEFHAALAFQKVTTDMLSKVMMARMRE